MLSVYEARLRHARYFEGVLGEARKLDARGEGQPGDPALFEQDRENILAAIRWTTSLAGDDDAVADLCVRFLCIGSSFLILRQHSAERVGWLEAGLAAARRLNQPAFESLFLHQLGNAYFISGDYQKAVALGTEANGVEFDLRQVVDDGTLLSSYGGRLYAEAGYVIGEIDRKAAFYELVSLLHRRLEGGVDGEPASTETDAQEGIELAQAALHGFRESGDKASEAAALAALGMAYAGACDLARAIETSQQARRLYCELKDKRSEADTVGRLVWFYSLSNDQRRSFDLAVEALAIYRQVPDAGGEMLAHATLGVLHSLAREHVHAVEHHQRALDLARRLGDTNYEAVILGQLSLCAELLGDREQMLARAGEAVAVLKRSGHQDVVLLKQALDAEKSRES
jgi:tetratricopeptide (TPR) repeat protein